MSKEFPVQPGRILCDKHFVAAMKGLCGSEFTVTRVRNGLIDGHNTTWKVTADMLEPAVAIPEIEESTMALETILC
ncbi:MAG: hypothetical protein IKL29_01970 [Bacteroidaceae bacterium]|nr:hypothetical protein [Bacteroidaceae bacterium]